MTLISGIRLSQKRNKLYYSQKFIYLFHRILKKDPLQLIPFPIIN